MSRSIYASTITVVALLASQTVCLAQAEYVVDGSIESRVNRDGVRLFELAMKLDHAFGHFGSTDFGLVTPDGETFSSSISGIRAEFLADSLETINERYAGVWTITETLANGSEQSYELDVERFETTAFDTTPVIESPVDGSTVDLVFEVSFSPESVGGNGVTYGDFGLPAGRPEIEFEDGLTRMDFSFAEGQIRDAGIDRLAVAQIHNVLDWLPEITPIDAPSPSTFISDRWSGFSFRNFSDPIAVSFVPEPSSLPWIGFVVTVGLCRRRLARRDCA